MTKTKRLTSVLLTLCLSVAMLAGVMLATPLQVYAEDNEYTFDDLYVGQILYPTDWYNSVGMDVSFFVHLSLSDYKKPPETHKEVRYIGGPVQQLSKVFLFLNSESAYIVKLNQTADRQIVHLIAGLPPKPTPNQSTPTDAPDHGTDEYLLRHDDFWFPIYCQLMAGTNTESVTVDTSGHDIDMVIHYVFDALKNTNRTLTIKHQGETYVIRGAPESADYLKMGKILLGHNHSFAILGWATQWVA